ncbi:MAG: BatA domain-containing protein [Saprospiraceae bacterium]|nr:BatA domain-containing protein [Saprospiraceae bacterium]MDW8484581.1 BatA domain-containing protein [Saprospiraceae bacterium]
MQFVFPGFLAAVIAIAIPIIIHLFYFKRFKKVYFSHVRFLQEVKEVTNNRQRLRNLLVLLMRCLAVISLVLAFAQPFIPRSSNVRQGRRAVSIYVDNSFSMAALSEDAPLVELAKQRARQIIKAYGASDQFQVLTTDLEGRDQRLVSQEDALARVDEIRLSSASRTLSQVLIRQRQALSSAKTENQIIYLISDFQANRFDLQNFRDTSLSINLVPLRAVQERNLSIDSAWFDSPVQILNHPATLLVKTSNHSDESVEEVPLSLFHDGQNKPAATLQLPPRSTRTDTVRFNILRPGWYAAKLSISDYPVQFDDHYFFTFYVAERVNVLFINDSEPNRYLSRAFAGASFFRIDNADVRTLDYSRFADYQLIVLHEPAFISSGLTQELKTFIQNGGNVLFFPAQNGDLNSYNSFLQTFQAGNLGPFQETERQIAQLNTQEFIFRDVFLNTNANLRLPLTRGNFRLSPQYGEHILTYRDGSAALAKYPLGQGALYLSAAPLNDKVNDLVHHGEVFVPLLFRAALAGAKDRRIASTLGRDEVLELNHSASTTGETIYKMRQKREKGQGQETTEAAITPEFIPEQRILGAKALLTPGTQIKEAGWYEVLLRDSVIATYAFNYDRSESDLRCLTEAELEKQLGPAYKLLSHHVKADFTAVVAEEERGTALWRWCLVFALLFLAVEALLLRLWKP